MRFISILVTVGLGLSLGPVSCHAGHGEAHTTETEPTETADTQETGSFPPPNILSFEEIPLADGWNIGTDFQFIPNTSPTQFIVLDKDGRVGHFEIDGNTTAKLGEFEVNGVASEEDCGLISLAIDPDFAGNRMFYVGACISLTNSAVYRYILDPSDYPATAATQTEILNEGDPASMQPWHGIGSIAFDDEGMMWVLMGDHVVKENAQDPTTNLGALLRIEPNRDPMGSGHTPAPDNPFADSGSPDLYAIGLRSPWRGFLDSQQRFWFGDVGSNEFEEINVVREAGQNFGWPEAEGPCEEDCDGLTDPVASWPRGSNSPYIADDPLVEATNFRVGFVGLEYLDQGNDRYDGELTDQVIFSDICLGWVRRLGLDSDGTVANDDHIAHLSQSVAWRQAEDGYIYALTYGSCISQVDPPPVSRLLRVELASRD